MLENKLIIFRKQYRMQILGALTIQIIIFTHGFSTGCMSPIVEIIQSPKTPLSFSVTVEEISWISSMFGVGFLAGTILFAVTINRFRRKFNLYILPLPNMLFWILAYFVQNIDYLYAGRFLAGVTGGGLFLITPIFQSEILNKNIRGAIMSSGMLFLSGGTVTGFVLPSVLNYHVIPCIGLLFSIVFLIALYFFPETPQSLLKSNNILEAKAAFDFYNGLRSEKNSLSYSLKASETVQSEFEELSRNILNGDSSQPITIDDFLTKSALKALANGVVLCSLHQLSGCYASLNYMASIFTASGSVMDPYFCTNIVGISHIIGCCFAALLVEYLGRRAILFLSTLGMSVGMFIFGAFIQLADNKMLEVYYWAPLVLMMIVAFFTASGLFGSCLVILVEIMPTKIRTLALPMAMTIFSLLVFIMLKIYPYFLFELGVSTTMYSSATVSVVTTVYLYIFLPETKGKSMDAE
ncbi:facilitated trehalose transporter Tret1-like [Bactrocera neohumeralis]|uniref:facilitated trehalose transporter Tret1-like n=1 Tax=Bactrocera neohumeralis TaxID=98809 RepID=UPI002165E517|nr:facilitated trehalose transporter Tret1-like [Bactrocera neohumeralis]